MSASSPEPGAAGASLVAINVGNSRVQIGLFVEGELDRSERFAAEDLVAIVERLASWWSEIASHPRSAFVLASVNDSVADRIVSAVHDQLSIDVYRVGADLPVPVAVSLEPETLTGTDRLLNALAAWVRLRQACVVVDAGTAVTVDFVDGEGVFHGGAIAPGARLQLRSLAQHTVLLPEIDFAAPADETFGRSTSQAMLNGVYHGIRGMVWRLVERYAERYGAYPMVIATGGDAEVLFGHDELIDRIVPALTLHGIAIAAERALAGKSC